jgi:cell division protein FtsQ
MFRLLVRVIVPFSLALGGAGIWLSDQDRRDEIRLTLSDMRRSVETRPEFMVTLMATDGASEGLSDDIREIMPIDFPVSSFDLNLENMRAQLMGLSPVADASVRIRAGGILQIDITEREPVMVWRSAEGMMLVDNEGIVVAVAGARSDTPELPLMAGVGADEVVQEALQLIETAGPLADRVRGVVRMGGRRWDVVLDRDQRIMLPEYGAVQAFERVIALSQAHEMLARDLVVVDMRLSERPTIRIAERSVQEWWKIRQISVGQEENND